eukprot:2589563-Alexandrium_andersonii.AAC.1
MSCSPVPEAGGAGRFRRGEEAAAASVAQDGAETGCRKLPSRSALARSSVLVRNCLLYTSPSPRD